MLNSLLSCTKPQTVQIWIWITDLKSEANVEVLQSCSRRAVGAKRLLSALTSLFIFDEFMSSAAHFGLYWIKNTSVCLRVSVIVLYSLDNDWLVIDRLVVIQWAAQTRRHDQWHHVSLIHRQRAELCWEATSLEHIAVTTITSRCVHTKNKVCSLLDEAENFALHLL